MKNLLSFLIWDKSILPNKYRVFSLLLILIIFIGFFAELLSIGLVVPLITAMFDKSKIDYYLQFVPEFINIDNFVQNDFIFLFLILLVGVYFLKAFIIFFQNFLIAKYCLSVGLYIQDKMIRNYLNKSIDYYNNINSSIIIRNLSTEVALFTQHILIPFFSMITEILVLIGIVGIILYVELKIGLYILLIASLTIFILRSIFVKKLIEWGLERQKHQASSIQKINDIFFLNREIKILKKEDFFLKKLYLSFYKLAKAQFKKKIIQPIPRLTGEILAIVSFSVLIMSLTNDKKTNSEIIIVLALFAACALRLIPSFNRISELYSTFKFSLSCVQVVMKEIKPDNFNLLQNEYNDINKESFRSLTVENLNFKYDDKKILDSLNIQINKGDIIGIIGKSGSGKTTLVNILLGFHKINQEIIYNNIKKKDLRAWLSKVGYVPQDTFMLDETIRKNIAFGVADKEIHDGQVLKAIHDSQLTDTIKSLDAGLNTLIGENGVRLSGGQKQRLGIARALYSNPDVLIFDEVTSSLDLKTEKEFLKSIFALKDKKTILIVTHRPSLLEACNKIYKLENGKLILNE